MNKMDMIRKLLSRGSQTAPALIDDVAEEINPIARRAGALEADEIIDGVSPRVKPDIDIPEGELVAPKVSTLDAVKEFGKKNKGKIIGGLTLAEMARQMIGQDDKPVMLTPPPEAKEKGAVDAPKAEANIDSAVKSEKSKALTPAPTLDSTDEEPSRSPSASDLYMQQLLAAQDKDSDSTLMNSLIRSGTMAGSAIAMVPADYSGVESLEKGANRNVGKFKEQITTKGTAQALDAADRDATDEKSLRDPNSKVSQETKAQLAKYGINVKTAMEAKQLNPQIFNLLMADRAQQNQKEIAGMNVEATKNKLNTTLDEKQRKFARDLRKEATTGVLGKQYATYSTGQRMHQGLSEFAKNPSGYKDYATLMGGLKTLQGDESVVREAEVRLGINATSAINKAMNYLNAAANGRQLQPSQRAEMIDTINILNEASRKQYMQSVSPILEQADAEGIPHSTILSGSLSGAAEKSESAPSQYSPKEEAGIENFAKAKGVSRDEAISKLKAGGRLK